MHGCAAPCAHGRDGAAARRERRTRAPAAHEIDTRRPARRSHTSGSRHTEARNEPRAIEASSTRTRDRVDAAERATTQALAVSHVAAVRSRIREGPGSPPPRPDRASADRTHDEREMCHGSVSIARGPTHRARARRAITSRTVADSGDAIRTLRGRQGREQRDIRGRTVSFAEERAGRSRPSQRTACSVMRAPPRTMSSSTAAPDA